MFAAARSKNFKSDRDSWKAVIEEAKDHKRL
jgi:hypothetical protein